MAHNRGDRERNELKLKKVMTDIAHLYERFNSDLPVNHPVSRYSYLILNPVEYMNSVLANERLTIRKNSNNTLSRENSINDVCEKPIKQNNRHTLYYYSSIYFVMLNRHLDSNLACLQQ